MTRLLSVGFALTLVLAFAVPAFAADSITSLLAKEDATGSNVKPLSGSTTAAFDDPDNFTIAGLLGLGTDTPAQRMHIYQPSAASARFRIENTAGVVDMLTVSNSFLLTIGGVTQIRISGGGNVMFGPSGSAAQAVHINRDSTASVRLRLENDEGSTDLYTDGGGMGFLAGGATRAFISSAGNVGIGVLNPTTKLHVSGETTTSVLNITGGSDLSEHFDIQSETAVQPGMVVAINPSNPGQLCVSSKAYDRTVAGIVSGAGGVNPGMIMGHQGTIANGEHPVALTGRVYAMADATQHAIVPGDLLTTSATPGHAMKVTDYEMAKGAIIGKAMTPLAQGEKGLVLVLVSLQ